MRPAIGLTTTSVSAFFFHWDGLLLEVFLVQRKALLLPDDRHIGNSTRRYHSPSHRIDLAMYFATVSTGCFIDNHESFSSQSKSANNVYNRRQIYTQQPAPPPPAPVTTSTRQATTPAIAPVVYSIPAYYRRDGTEPRNRTFHYNDNDDDDNYSAVHSIDNSISDSRPTPHRAVALV